MLGATQIPTPVFNTHFLIKVPKELAADPARHTTSVELSSHQPHLLMGRERHHSAAGHSQWGPIRERSLFSNCGGLAVSSQETPFTSLLLALFRREPVHRFFSRIQRTSITVTRRCHSSVYIQFIYSSQTFANSHPAPLPGTYILLYSWG